MNQQAPHHHESIRALMTEALDGESPEQVIRRKAQQIVSKYRPLWMGPPFCPRSLADLEGIVVEEALSDIPSDGWIFSRGGRVYIQHAKGQSEERIRFTICHELGHTLFPDCFKRERMRTRVEKAEREFESLCDAAASEFLFPQAEFLSDMGSGRLNANGLKQLATRYHASVDATAWRIVQLSQIPVCVVFARYVEPVGKGVTSLKVKYAVQHPQFPYKIYPNFKINSKSVANAAYLEKRTMSASRENWYIAGKWARMSVEVVPLPRFESKETADLAILLYAN